MISTKDTEDSPKVIVVLDSHHSKVKFSSVSQPCGTLGHSSDSKGRVWELTPEVVCFPGDACVCDGVQGQPESPHRRRP